MAMGLQLQAARMSDADLAKLTRVAPPGGLVVPSDAEQKQKAATQKLFEALELRYVEEVINSVKQALKDGANVHQKDWDGYTPLMVESAKNLTPEALEIIDILLQSGSDVNARDKYNNETPLMIAADRGNKNVVRHLLDAEGVDVTLKDDGGKTALDKAKDNANEYLDNAKGWAKAAKEYDQIPVDKDGESEFNLGRATYLFRKSNLVTGTKKFFKQQSQKYYRAHFDAVKIVKMLEKRAN